MIKNPRPPRCWDDEADCDCGGYEPAPALSETEAAIVAHFENGEAAPESWVQQHTSEPTCFCGPRQVGTLGVWTHNMGDES